MGNGGPPDKFAEQVDVSGLSGDQILTLVNEKVDEHKYNTFLAVGSVILFGYYK